MITITITIAVNSSKPDVFTCLTEQPLGPDKVPHLGLKIPPETGVVSFT